MELTFHDNTLLQSHKSYKLQVQVLKSNLHIDMYHYVYQIENLVNGKIYIGKHSTENMDDGYMGSGTLLQKAINKHGLGNFKKTILQEFESSEEAFLFEAQLVNVDFVDRDDTYNLKLGGKSFSTEDSKALAYLLWTSPDFQQFRIEFLELMKSPEHRQKMSALMKEHYKTHDGAFTGKTHTQETKEKIGTKNSLSQRGSLNSRHGTCWLFDPRSSVEKSVSVDEVENYLTDGWVRGRNPRKFAGKIGTKGKVWVSHPAHKNARLISKDELAVYEMQEWRRGRNHVAIP